jgi:hypothetical protein
MKPEPVWVDFVSLYTFVTSLFFLLLHFVSQISDVTHFGGVGSFFKWVLMAALSASVPPSHFVHLLILLIQLFLCHIFHQKSHQNHTTRLPRAIPTLPCPPAQFDCDVVIG